MKSFKLLGLWNIIFGAVGALAFIGIFIFYSPEFFPIGWIEGLWFFGPIVLFITNFLFGTFYILTIFTGIKMRSARKKGIGICLLLIFKICWNVIGIIWSLGWSLDVTDFLIIKISFIVMAIALFGSIIVNIFALFKRRSN